MAGEVTIEDCHPTQLWDACDPYGEGPAILKIIETPDPALYPTDPLPHKTVFEL